MPRHLFEPRPNKRRRIPRRSRTRRQLPVQRISLNRRRLRPSRHLHRLADQRRRNTPPPIPDPDVKTGDRPNRLIIHAPHPPRVLEPGQGIARRHLAPPHRNIPIEGQQPRRRPRPHHLPERAAIFLIRPLAIRRADTPVHAPAPAARPARPKQVFQRRPKLRYQRLDPELQWRLRSMRLLPCDHERDPCLRLKQKMAHPAGILSLLASRRLRPTQEP